MGNIKFQFVTILLIIGVGLVGFLALRSLKNPETYIKDTDEVVGDMTNQDGQVPADGTGEPSTTGTGTAVPDGTNPQGTDGTTATTTASGTATGVAPTPTPGTTGQYAALIANLEKMKTAGTIYKEGMKGAEVGYIQQALNAIDGGTTAPDNDYGPGTVTRIKAFQQKNGIAPISGQTAGKTLTKMIELLKAKG